MAEAWVCCSPGGQASDVTRIGSDHRWGLPADGDHNIPVGMCLAHHCVTSAQYLCHGTVALMGLRKDIFPLGH